jgi:DNA-binding SARP family transcriptional activator
VSIYKGNLLDENFFQPFFEEERRKYQDQILDALFWLPNYHASQGNDDAVEKALSRAIALAPCEEEGYLRLMAHHQARGRLEKIRQIYWDCRKALKAHLDAVPSPAFEASYRTFPRPGTGPLALRV